jgi:hypothetical protein
MVELHVLAIFWLCPRKQAVPNLVLARRAVALSV